MQKRRFIILASGLAMFLPVPGYAQSVADMMDLGPEERRAYIESMSPDERGAMRDKWRSELDGMSDGERQAFRESMAANRPQGRPRRLAMREHRESMSDEERAEHRQNRQEMRAKRRQQWESMSDDERDAARSKMRGHRHGGKHSGRRQQDESAGETQ